MYDIAIKVENLSKRYRIGLREERHDTLVGAMTSLLRQPSKNLKRLRRLTMFSDNGQGDESDVIWALKDVSFEVKRGEVVGIIGRNGAGKSSLLKILSRITHPTSGRVELHGRVSSLLEVGTGFHPELTGRENIYLNGTILGMAKAEVDRKFDEIVNFSDVKKFIDTPVKFYSSGMRVRLAFSVAAHLEPEILLVDEVLAVGDAEFQRRCLGKMGDIAKEGRTVLFVSHNMATIKALCQLGIYLDRGTVKLFGDVATCISTYLKSATVEAIPHFEAEDDPSLPVQLLSVNVVNELGELATHHPHDQPFWLKIRVLVRSRISNVYLAAIIHDSDLDTLIFTRDFELDGDNLLQREPGLYTYSIKIPAPLLVPGSYSVSVHVARSAPAQIINGADHVCPFEIIDNGSEQAKMGFPSRGKISIPLRWECDGVDQPIQLGHNSSTRLINGLRGSRGHLR